MTAARPAAARPGIRVLLLVLAAVAATLGACSSSGSAESAPSLTQVAQLLARHGAAVRNGDRGAFLRDIDGSAKARVFREQQAGVFDNLRKVPFSAWSYRVGSRTDDAEFERSASRRFGTAAVIVRVSLRFALRGADRQPTSHDLWWTFVRRGGAVRIAGDDGLAEAGGVSWQGPWDFGPLQVVRGRHGIVLGHGDNAAALGTVSRTVDAAVPTVTAVWGTNWSGYVAVVVPSSAAELTAQVGQSSTISTEVAAAAVSDGQDVLSGHAYGQRLVVNPAALAKLSDVGRRIVVQHEITHIATADATGEATPRWLAEGFADYVGNLGSGQTVPAAAQELRAEVRRGTLPAALPGEASFDTDGQAPQAYEGAWLACRLLAAKAGQAGLVRFYRQVGASELDPAGAVAAALGSVLHESTARFTAQWRAYLQAQLG